MLMKKKSLFFLSSFLKNMYFLKTEIMYVENIKFCSTLWFFFPYEFLRKKSNSSTKQKSSHNWQLNLLKK